MGKLFLVPTPIGNSDDITLRALEVLRTVDEVICEERKVGSRLLKQHGIHQDLRTLNEHNEAEQIKDLLDLLKAGKQLALISDAGTPVFADPGYRLLQAIIACGGEIISLPGPSSLMTALVVSGLPCQDFYCVGFLPRKTELRRKALRRLKSWHTTLVIYEAPYRLIPLLKDVAGELGGRQPASLCVLLSYPEERVLRGNLKEILSQCEASPFKGEFVLLVDNRLSPERVAFNRGKSSKTCST
jgi:16S rRNA (cytidine1402-2'-O)-methyltransferase